MSAPILATKLYIPHTRPNLVQRPRLIKHLDEGLDSGGKLTLVSAPAGFGKTTLLADWGSQLADSAVTPPKIKLAWLSLDDGDNDPVRFLTYFITALQQIAPSIGQTAQMMLHVPQPQSPPLETLITTLINDISAAFTTTRCVFVLDDYHLIEAQPIHDALTFLLEHLPPPPGGMHLVIATREDPPLPLARLRARGQLTELRATELRFTSSESVEFLNQIMDLDLSDEDIVALETRTEGWIAGLHLAAISMQGHEDAPSFIKSFTGSHHFILDYLIEEVLEKQPESIQTFLLQTATLDRLTGSLCDALCEVSGEDTGQNNGQATLEMLERANLFIVPLDEERRWYRYHHLFADLLRQRLHQTQPEQTPRLHRRASEWFEQNGFVDEAIEHTLRAEDYEQAAHLIEEHIDAMWRRGKHTNLRRWLAELSDELIFSKPQLCIFRAWYLFASGQQAEAERFLQTIDLAHDSSTDHATETELQKQAQIPGSNRLMLQGRAAAIRAFMAGFRADVPAIIKHARQALEYLPERDLTWRSTAAVALGDGYGLKGDMISAYQARLEASEVCKAAGNIYFLLVANIKLAMTMREQGRLRETIKICEQQVQLANENGLSQTGVVGGLMAIWGEVLAEFDDLEGAKHLAKKGALMTEHGGPLAAFGWSHLLLMRILFSCRDLAGMEELIQKMEKIDRESNIPPWITKQMATWQNRLWLAQDELEAASQWVEVRGLVSAGESKPLRELDYFWLIEYIVLARILIAQGRLDETVKLLQLLLEAAETGGRTTRVIEILLLQALAFQAGGDTNRAMTTLERALTLAEPGGFIRIFVDEGPSMARLLYEALNREIATDYVRRLLQAFPIEEPKQIDPSESQVSESGYIEPLSEREIEVLQFIAEGLTNQEIATKLFLSLHTVKTHARNIYSKLNAHNRTEAVARARAVGILPST